MVQKFGICICHNKHNPINSRGLCPEGARERHEHSAAMKNMVVKKKRNEKENEIKDEFDTTRRRTTELGSIQEPTEFNREQQGEVSKTKSFNFKTSKIKHRSEKGKEIVKNELLLFQKIFNERPPWCEWCKTSIKVFNPCNYHHIRTKGSHPELRLVESNIVKICVDCHLKEHGFKPRIKLQ